MFSRSITYILKYSNKCSRNLLLDKTKIHLGSNLVHREVAGDLDLIVSSVTFDSTVLLDGNTHATETEQTTFEDTVRVSLGKHLVEVNGEATGDPTGTTTTQEETTEHLHFTVGSTIDTGTTTHNTTVNITTITTSGKEGIGKMA